MVQPVTDDRDGEDGNGSVATVEKEPRRARSRRGVAGAVESLRAWFARRFPLEPPLE